MPELVSPGVSVSVVDESMYAPSGQGTVPLVFIATGQDKPDSAGSGIASGTTATNVEKPFLITSQRELVNTFGTPSFQSVAGTPLHADERNEYGLLAAYQFLGIANRAYVVRANVNLDELEGSATAPSIAPADGTYWLDTSNSKFGIHSWNTTTSSWDVVEPTVLSDKPGVTGSRVIDSADNFRPIASFGQADDYAIVALTGNVPVKLYQKLNGQWQVVGENNWINTTNSISGSNGTVQIKTGLGANKPTNGSTKYDVWVKTNSVSNGMDIKAYLYNASTATWQLQQVPVFSNDDSYAVANDMIVGNLYAQFDDVDDPDWIATALPVQITAPTDDSQSKGAISGSPEVIFNIKRAAMQSAHVEGWSSLHAGVNLTGTNTAIIFSVCGQDVTVTAAGGAGSSVTLDEIVAGINNNATLQGYGIVAEKTELSASRKYLKLSRTLGKAIWIEDGAGSGTTQGATVQNLGFDDTVAGKANDQDSFADFFISNASSLTVYASPFRYLQFEASTSAPKRNPVNGTMWYDTNISADIYVNENSGGTMKWLAYANSKDQFDNTSVASGGLRDLQMVTSAPTTKSDGVTGLGDGDIWIDTDELDVYPKVYKYNGTTNKWVLLDNSDQSSDMGVVFADAGGDPSGADLDEQGWGMKFADMDSDSPDPSTFPDGILLFNMRLSGNSVKKYTTNYEFDGTDNGDTWVSASGVDTAGVPYMGRKSQRKVIVKAMADAMVSNDDIRAESRFYNLIAAPGYPELLDEMVALNNDRKQTAFIIVDTPFRLNPSGTTIQNWATNANNAVENGEDGLITASNMAGAYYPSGFATNLDGGSVVVPPSHIALRTIAFNDQVAFPWFAPAGLTRGLVDNATSVGFIDSKEGEFQPVQLTEGQRDTLYANKINPIAFIPNRGLVVFGQKTLASVASAMDRVNVARLLAFLRFELDNLAKPFLFEPNDIMTRGQVEDTFNRFLEELITKRGLFDFLVVCDDTNNTPARIDRNELYIDIAIQPVKAIEFIYIPVRIKNTGESLSN